jgi:hypothetical protein
MLELHKTLLLGMLTGSALNKVHGILHGRMKGVHREQQREAAWEVIVDLHKKVVANWSNLGKTRIAQLLAYLFKV